MQQAVVVSAVRTPIGRYGGSLKDVTPDALATLILSEVCRRAHVEIERVEEVVLGQAYQNGEAANVARLAALRAGFPDTTCGITVDRRCASGLSALEIAAHEIEAGTVEVAIAGGVESMSQAEYYLPGAVRWGLKRGNVELQDRIVAARVHTNPVERYGPIPSNITWAENIAAKYGIARERQDAWALRSHQRAAAAIASGAMREEIVAVPVAGRKGASTLVELDEHVRADTSLESLAALPPLAGSTCTAGNSSGENDGAAALLLMSAARAAALGLESWGTLRAFAVAGTDPRYASDAVDAAVAKVLARTGVRLDQIDLIEINEAFASQILANLDALGLADADRVNVNGSGISLGHPVGCTGARIVVTLLHEMRRRHARRGLAALCVGGGMGMAVLVEK
jgi:acetyl-CoA C-acetyltransferase